QRCTADEVQVQVIDLLPAVRVAVDDQPVAVLGDALLAGQVARHHEHPADQRRVFVSDVVGGGNDLVRDDQDVHRCARVDVAKGGDLFILIEDVRGQFAGRDAFEERRHEVPVGRGGCPYN